MTMTPDELKAAYDQALKDLVERYKEQSLKAIFLRNFEEGHSQGLPYNALNADQFLEQNDEAIRALSREQCIELLGKIEKEGRSDWT